MNAFEQIASKFFDARGYWTRVGLKVDLTKEEKVALGNHSMPRPEIDIVAFKPNRNQLLIVECKSYLDSNGVQIEHLHGEKPKLQARLKLLTNAELRAMVTRKLVLQLRAEDLLLSGEPVIGYALVAGNIKNGHEQKLKNFFADNHWLLVTPNELADGLRRFADRGYEDDAVTMVVKLLERNARRGDAT